MEVDALSCISIETVARSARRARNSLGRGGARERETPEKARQCKRVANPEWGQWGNSKPKNTARCAPHPFFDVRGGMGVAVQLADAAHASRAPAGENRKRIPACLRVPQAPPRPRRTRAAQRCTAQANASLQCQFPARPQLVYTVAAAVATQGPSPPAQGPSQEAQLALMLGWIACVLSGALAAALLAAVPALGEQIRPLSAQLSWLWSQLLPAAPPPPIGAARRFTALEVAALTTLTTRGLCPLVCVAGAIKKAADELAALAAAIKDEASAPPAQHTPPDRVPRLPEYTDRCSHKAALFSSLLRICPANTCLVPSHSQVPDTAATVRLSGLELSDTIEEFGHLG